MKQETVNPETFPWWMKFTLWLFRKWLKRKKFFIQNLKVLYHIQAEYQGEEIEANLSLNIRDDGKMIFQQLPERQKAVAKLLELQTRIKEKTLLEKPIADVLLTDDEIKEITGN